MIKKTVLFFILLTFSYKVVADDSSDSNEAGQYKMSFEELALVRISNSASHLKLKINQTPASVTKISAEMIEESGARSLDALLRQYVPGLQIMSKINGGDQLGIRGIISDRNNKFLLLVNGKVMNEHTQWGAITERDLSMLGDIHHIDVVRGPGSVLYGPGAIAGVVNIITHTADTFDGFEIKTSRGFVENFTNFELRLGHTFDNDSQLFAYYGVDKYRGASVDDAPQIYSNSFISPGNGPVYAGSPYPYGGVNDNRSYRNNLRHKFHINYQIDQLQLTLRYTRGGKYGNTDLKSVMKFSDHRGVSDRSYGYQQFTFMADYDWLLSQEFHIDFRLSYDMLDSESENGAAPMLSYREDEYYARTMAHWTPSDNHQFVLGFEFFHEIFGLDSPGYPSTDPNIEVYPKASPWYSDSRAIIGEYMWDIYDELSFMTGIRIDSNEYSSHLWSNRNALMWSPNEKDTFKLLYNQALRRSDEGELRRIEELEKDSGATDKLRLYEIRYERQHSDELWLALSSYYGDYSIISWANGPKITTPVGNLQYYGLELELSYQTDQYKIALAHSYTQHLDFESTRVANNVTMSHVTDSDDLSNWSTHQTTLYGSYKFNKRWKANASLLILWGFPGAESFAEYNNTTLGWLSLPVSDPGEDRAFEESVFLNMGLEYKATENLTFQLNAYNVLGWFDKDLNKQNRFQGSSHYQNEAAAVGCSISYKF